MPGEISVPASITREQLQTVLEGGQVRVTLNELTGESRMLSLNPGQEDTLYGFLLYEAGEEPAGRGYETGIRPDYNTDEYLSLIHISVQCQGEYPSKCQECGDEVGNIPGG